MSQPTQDGTQTNEAQANGTRANGAREERRTENDRPDPETVETAVFRRADPPGDPGWLYLRDNLWRGECGDAEYMREVTEDALGVPVDSVSFRELRTSQSYLDDLRDAAAADLDLFNADTVDEVLSKYLGSSIHVTDEV